MKAAFVLACVGAVVAQNLEGEPACATSCLSSAISAVGCKPTDMDCQCGSQSAIGATVAGCLIGACTNPADLASAASVGSALCASYLATASASATTAGTSTSVSVTTDTSVVSTITTSRGSSSTTGPITGGTGVLTTTSTKTNGTFTTGSPTGAGQGSTSTAVPTNAAAKPAGLGLGAVLGMLGAAVL